jgi:hypothetical protein
MSVNNLDVQVCIYSVQVTSSCLIVCLRTGVEEHLAIKHGLGGLGVFERREALQHGAAVKDVRAVNFKLLNILNM